MLFLKYISPGTPGCRPEGLLILPLPALRPEERKNIPLPLQFSFSSRIFHKAASHSGGFSLLGIQLTGVVSVLAWTAATMFVVFTVINKTIGLRVTDQEQIDGLDIHEHGMNAYAGFRMDR